MRARPSQCCTRLRGGSGVSPPTRIQYRARGRVGRREPPHPPPACLSRRSPQGTARGSLGILYTHRAIWGGGVAALHGIPSLGSSGSFLFFTQRSRNGVQSFISDAARAPSPHLVNCFIDVRAMSPRSIRKPSEGEASPSPFLKPHHFPSLRIDTLTRVISLFSFLSTYGGQGSIEFDFAAAQRERVAGAHPPLRHSSSPFPLNRMRTSWLSRASARGP